MNKTLKNTVSNDLINIHSVITRSINVSIEKSRLFREQGGVDTILREGFINYLNSLLNLFHSHHLVEDDLIFPYFENHQLQAPYGVMKSQHEDLLPLLDNLENSVNNLSSIIRP